MQFVTINDDLLMEQILLPNNIMYEKLFRII